MSSTIDRSRGERGQVLPILAFGMIAIIAIAALVFDVGQNLFDRRKLQDAADAGALAGARFINDPACAPTAGTRMTMACPAYAAALNILTDAASYHLAPSQITISIPPSTSTAFSNLPGHIQVTLDEQRGSFFAGVLGMTSFHVGGTAVAANLDGYPLPYSFLALNKTHCGAGQIGGNGTIAVNAAIFVNSSCTSSGAFQANGSNATISAPSCTTAGTASYQAPANVSCSGTGTTEHAAQMSDPLAGVGAPSAPGTPATPVLVGGDNKVVDKACPGGVAAATQNSPASCKIASTNKGVATVTLSPGAYWGGLNLVQSPGDNQLTVYLLPGIYYIGGGGLNIQGSIVVRTVADSVSTTLGGGVLIFNTDDQKTCANGGGGCIKAIDFQTTPTSDVKLLPYQGATYTNMLIYQDRDASGQPAMGIAGQATMQLSGTIYLPKAQFNYSGNGAGEVLNAQVICDQFAVSGNGSLQVTYTPSQVFRLHNVGLVQ